jgi:surfeit locus 1 family protein
VFVYLGFWQLGRAEQKKQLISIYQLNQQQIPVDWTELSFHSQDLNNPTLRMKRFHINGQFVPNIQILVDNKTQHGQVGFQVYAVFKPKDSEQSILVDRGFIPLNGKSRNNFQSPNLHSISTNITMHKITGTITIPSIGIQLNPEASIERLDTKQILIQQIHFETLSQYLNLPLAKFVFKLDPESPFILNFIPINFGLSVMKHVGYALQWFAMGIALLIYYFAINIIRYTQSESSVYEIQG